MHCRLIFIFFAIILTGSALPERLLADEHERKAVLVTGASSGIGRNITERLAREGFHVYAGARKDADLAELDALDNVTSVRLDVTRQDDIDAAVKKVKKGGRGLWGVVNNAGIGVFSPMNETAEQDIVWVHDVNVLGPYRVNKAFTPMLEESGGRTMIIGSISGYIFGARGGTYSMSKTAVEAYTDALAEELADRGVGVTIVEPGGYQSKIREKVTRYQLTGSTDEGAELTEEQRQAVAAARERNEQLKEPDEVADAVLHALTAATPRPRYMVVPNAEQAEATIRAALEKVVQLNADQPYAYDREELIALLDEMLAE